MPRAIRISLWSIALLAFTLGAGFFWVESQLRPEPLGERLKGLLADAGIKGGITRAEASLDGKFSAEGIDLTLADGTRITATAIKGEAGILEILTGTYAFGSLEIRNLELELSPGKIALDPAAPPTTAAATRTTLPPFILGPYAATGRVKLADGTLLRFSVRGDRFDSQGQADLRAGLAWPGFTLGRQMTDPQGQLSLKAVFQRPLGAEGLSLDELIADIGSMNLDISAKDAGPAQAGGVALNLQAAATPGRPGLGLTGTLSDSTGQPAMKLTGEHLAGRTNLQARLNVDSARLGILSRLLPDIRVTGTAEGEFENANWQGTADLKALWSDLGRFSPALPRNSRSEWKLTAKARSTPAGFAVNNLAVTGHGVAIAIPQTLTWKAGLLPENADDATVTITADDAELVALNPFLAYADLVATAGRWSGEAAVSFKDGKPVVRSPRTHRLRGVTLERAGKPLLRGVDAELPVTSIDGAITLKPFSLDSPAGNIAVGELTLRPGAEGAWAAEARINLGLVELAAQPNWEDLPVDKLKGVRVRAQATVTRAAGQAPVVTSADARIFRQGLDLLSLKLRQPYPTAGARPTGVLVEATARDLPLESLAALVPGLKLTGDLKRADLVAGHDRGGYFIRTEGAPVAFLRTSVGWEGKPYVKDCDLTASLDLLMRPGAPVLGFDKAELRNRQRILAAGDIRLGLGTAPTTLSLAGDLGALAEQPFAEMFRVITGGQYRAVATLAPGGEMKASLQVNAVSLRDSPGRLTQATITGSRVPASGGHDFEGVFRLQATQLSSGKLRLEQRTTGTKHDWRGDITLDQVDIDDLLTLLPLEDKTVAQERPGAPRPDRIPFWHGQSGALRLTIGAAKAYGIRAEKVLVLADARENSLRLSQLTGQLAEGMLAGHGQLAFQPTLSNGPYNLAATLSLKQFDFAGVAQVVPAMKSFVQGKADATVGLTSVCGTPGELLGKLQIDGSIESRNGRIRAFGEKGGALSASAQNAGDLGETIGALTMLGGLFTKDKQKGGKIGRLGAAFAAGGKLQKAFADFPYTSAVIKVSRLASGTIKLESADIRSETLRIDAQGAISVSPGTDLADWPMKFSTRMRGSGEFAQYFKDIGFATGPTSADGLTNGPEINISGSLNGIRTDLAEKISAAIDGLGADPAPSGQTPAPGTQAAPETPEPRRRSPLGDLLNGIGR